MPFLAFLTRSSEIINLFQRWHFEIFVRPFKKCSLSQFFTCLCNKNIATFSGCDDFHQLGPLGRVGIVVDMSVCLCMECPLPMRFFLGLSLALRSHDQFEASDWSTLLLFYFFFWPKAPWRRRGRWQRGGIKKKKLKRFLFKFVSVPPGQSGVGLG